MEPDRFLLILSEADPVAASVYERFGNAPSSGSWVDGVPIRRLRPGVLLLRRPGPHIHDEHLDARLPLSIQQSRIPLVFPSIHRSEAGVRCFTVHALGNFGPLAEVGGEPERLVPSAPRLMTHALRRLSAEGRSIGLMASFEATHHGPALGMPAFFAEIGYADDVGPPPEAVEILARVLPELSEDPRDRIAVGVGGGHYAPHFTGLALERHWAFGHIISRHVLNTPSPGHLPAALEATPGAEGILVQRASDVLEGPARGFGPRLREGSAPRR